MSTTCGFTGSVKTEVKKMLNLQTSFMHSTGRPCELTTSTTPHDRAQSDPAKRVNGACYITYMHGFPYTYHMRDAWSDQHLAVSSPGRDAHVEKP